MKKHAILSILILTSLFLNAQTQSGSIRDIQNNQRNRPAQTTQDEQRKGFQKENLRFGGNFGLMFGTITIIDISPSVGYQFTRRFQAGMGLIYNYYSDSRFTPKFSMNIFGASPYAQFTALQTSALHLFLRAEYGLLSHEIDPWSPVNTRQWVQYPMIGGGLFLPVGQNGGLSVQLMWDLYEKPYSVYASNPIIRIGFMFGL